MTTLTSIILVDDDALCRGILAQMLQRLYPNAKIVEAADGQIALDLINDRTSLIIGDVDLQRYSALKLCWSLRNAAPYRPWRRTPVVFMTSRPIDQKLMAAAWQAGSTVMLSKPFDEDELELAVRKATGVSGELVIEKAAATAAANDNAEIAFASPVLFFTEPTAH